MLVLHTPLVPHSSPQRMVLPPRMMVAIGKKTQNQVLRGKKIVRETQSKSGLTFRGFVLGVLFVYLRQSFPVDQAGFHLREICLPLLC